MTDQHLADPHVGGRNPSVAPLPSNPAVDGDEAAQRIFSTSIVVSAIRCTLTYVIFPFVAPFAGFADFGATIGVIIGTVAIVANIVSIRRMWNAEHRWRKPVTLINLAMIGLVLYLVIDDVRELLG